MKAKTEKRIEKILLYLERGLPLLGNIVFSFSPFLFIYLFDLSWWWLVTLIITLPIGVSSALIRLSTFKS